MKNYTIVYFNDDCFSSEEIASIWSITIKDSTFRCRLLPYVWLIHSPYSITEMLGALRDSNISVDFINIFKANITEYHLPNIYLDLKGK